MKGCKLAFIIIILCCAATSCNTIQVGPKSQVTEYSEKTYNVQKKTELSIESDSSNIEVYSWEKMQVKFEINKVMRGFGKKERLSDKLINFKVNIQQKDNKLIFKSNYKGGIKNPADKSVDLKIFIPKFIKGIYVNLNTGKMNFYDDLNCDLNIRMNMANIDINRFEGKVNVKGDMGNLNIGGGRLTGESDVEINMGNISIKAAYDLFGPSSFKTELGNISLEFPEDSKISIEAVGNLKVNDFNHSKYPSVIKVESGMGKIDVKKSQ